MTYPSGTIVIELLKLSMNILWQRVYIFGPVHEASGVQKSSSALKDNIRGTICVVGDQ
ncbi:hypothetical protein K503DRAFT_775479 [Rhizopogon vinicolor AM-OR11-026]|uniref:Uncharacterized protein n=1 Tax=Rhizopogon vinicolor AM-OR11-026 TaxID=1314800 RepID=A0A1B7MLW1_9AGAM|nr:hypothetical protein K503DRAFT_775479 [Rhizopogon vinicolor AM-OR11-026]